MSRLDDLLHEELPRLAPSPTEDPFEGIRRRVRRRRFARRIGTTSLAVGVVAGAVLGGLGLLRLFSPPPTRVGGAVENGRIAFADRQGRPGSDFSGWRIFTVDPDGGGVVEVGPPGVEEALEPSWSPDGTRIAFSGSRGGGENGIFVMDPDGSNVRRILAVDRGDVTRLAWSPDGTRIAYVLHRGGGADPGTWTIWIVPADGGEPVELTTVGREVALSWAPDGQHLVIERFEPSAQRHPTDGEDRAGFTSDLYAIEVATGREERITASGDAHDPAWSPDGRTIAFVGENADRSLDLFLINADGTGRTRITRGPGDEYGPAWSPDGEMIAYAVRQVDPGFSESVCHLRVVDVVTLEDRSLVPSPGSEGCPGQGGISWGVRPPAGNVVDGTATPTPGATATPTPEATATPGATAPPTVGEDIGLGFPVCDVTSVPGTFAGDRQGGAYVASRVPPGGTCPRIERAEQILAVDVGGDGAADVSLDLSGCDPFCTAYAAPDVDGDGTSEVLVVNVQFSIVGLRLYDVVVGGEAGADGVAVVPVVVHGEGDPAVGIEPGAPPQLWRGGDAFEVAGLACAPRPEGRVLVYAEAGEEPRDSPDAVWKVHEVTLRLEGSSLGIVGTRDVETSSLDEIPGWDPAAPVCGARPRW